MLISSRNRLTTARRGLLGVTLIEVMMSTMVVSLGILGLVSLIPLGTHLTERGTRADRIASLGERIYHEAKIRGAFDASLWAEATGISPFNANTGPPTPLPVRQPYMIDPMFFGSNGTHASRAKFPYRTTFAIGGGSTAPAAISPNKELQMWRVSLQRSRGGAAMSLPHARLAFQSDDDLSIERPDDGELPPFQSFYRRGNPEVFVRRQAMGEYTWMIMLTPQPASLSRYSTLASLGTPTESEHAQPPINLGTITGFTNADAIRTSLRNAATDEYTASIIILKNRQGRIPAAVGDLTTNTLEATLTNERVVRVQNFISSGGYSTGEVQLQASGTREQAEELSLKLSNGDWICLAARLPLHNGFPRGDVYQWYRVVMVDDIVDSSGSITGTTAPFTRRVTISGPDWSEGIGTPAIPPTHAIIVDGVVGVYQKRVRLESRSPWTP